MREGAYFTPPATKTTPKTPPLPATPSHTPQQPRPAAAAARTDTRRHHLYTTHTYYLLSTLYTVWAFTRTACSLMSSSRPPTTQPRAQSAGAG